ncbi:MAG: GNAT family N-acetyltransferase [Fimbriimonadaceae bacterium]|nr:MAG: GNAT family N-acetyltransferase [Fimbriimonadaceae bacterium]
MEIVIRQWTEDDDVVALTEMIHRAYRRLADQGLNYIATTQSVATTEERLSEGESWCAELDGQVVGTITIFAPGEQTGCDYYRNKKPCAFGQFAIEPIHQGKGIGKLLLEVAERRGREWGATMLACDTSELARDLIAMYRKWGFKIVGEADWRPSVNYKSVILGRPIKNTSGI